MSESTASGRRRERSPRSDGIRTRRAILEHAARLATVEGVEGLSLGRLAESVGISKSGLFAHFGSKEELQLATVEAAEAIFAEVVVTPALAEPTALARLRALADRFLRHVEDGVFPGGCFFASAGAELDTHAGPVRDRALGMVAHWLALLEQTARDAQAEGSLAADVDVAQLVFELHAYLLLANQQWVAGGGSPATDRARRAVADLLVRSAPPERPARR